MSKIVADFKALSLDAQLQTYSEITAVLNAAKDARLLPRRRFPCTKWYSRQVKRLTGGHKDG